MLVFIDESGDPGFKTEKGASSVFVAAMVIFADEASASQTQAAIERLRVELGHPGEFKFNKCRKDTKDRFFEAVKRCGFCVRAIVIKKDDIYSPRLKTDKERFYEYFVNLMIKHDGGMLSNAKIIIDGSGDRQFRKSLDARLKRHAKSGSVKSVRFKDSRSDALVQLADMCVGAIARSYRKKLGDHDRWRKALAPRIDDVWEFR